MFRIQSKAVRTILRWQIIGTMIAASFGAVVFGMHSAMSIALGGGIGIVAAVAFDFAAGRGKTSTDAGTAVLRALRAEAVKIGVMVLLALLVFVIYKDVAKVSFVAAFLASMLALSMAFFTSNE